MKETSLRRRMVDRFVVDAGVSDQKVIAAMLRIPRHLFVEPALAHQAYTAGSLPIGYGQTISHPTTVAKMTESLELSGHEKILEIGTGSGYQAAVLAEIGCQVYTIERIRPLAVQAMELFTRLNYFRIAVRIGDGSNGWRQFAPYDRIIMTAYSSEISDALLQQLKENAILVMPLGTENEQKLVKITRAGDTFKKEILGDAYFVPLVNHQRGGNK